MSQGEQYSTSKLTKAATPQKTLKKKGYADVALVRCIEIMK